MDQSQITPPDSRTEDQSRPLEEVIQELVEELERLLESGQRLEAPPTGDQIFVESPLGHLAGERVEEVLLVWQPHINFN